MDKEVVKKQNHKLTLFALFLSLVSIGVLVFGFLLVSSNKVILLQSVSNIYNKINVFQNNEIKLLDKISESKDIGIKTEISFKMKDEILKVDFNYLENKNDNKSRLDLIVNYLDEELLNGNTILQDNKVYFFLKGITENYYYTDYGYQAFLKSLTSDEYNKLLEFFKDSVDEIVKNDDIKKDKVTVKYNGKDKKVNKLTYKLRNKDINKMINNFTKLLKSDKKLYKNIASYLEISVDDLDKQIEQLNSFHKNDEDKVMLEYDVYYFGFNKIFRYDLKHIPSNITLSYQENTGEDIIKLISNDKEMISLVVKNNKENYDYELNIASIFEDKIYTITGKYSNNNLTVNYDGNNININSTTLEKDGGYTTTSSIVLADDVTLDMVNTYYFDQKVKFNGKNSVDINDITPEDYELMINNFKESKLYEIFTSFEDILGMFGIKDIEFLEELK